MRWPLISITILACCAQAPNDLGNPLSVPLNGVSSIFGNAAYDKRRGQVEVVVKSNYTAIQDDIRAGGGPMLAKALDVAGVPQRDRPARIIQLRSDMGLYAASPGALVTALMVYGS